MAHRIVMPSFSMYTDEGTLVRWHKPSGAAVGAGEPVAEMETSKVLADVIAPASGILHHVAEPGAVLQVESLLGYILDPGEVPPAVEGPLPTQSPSVVVAPAREHIETDVPASPNARRVAAELGVSLAGVAGTGPGGRITEEDVRAAAEGQSR